MFNETLRIKPVLDSGALSHMDRSLNSRFAKIAKGFRSALKFAITGSALGLGASLLQKILNPIESLEDKIKSLLTQGQDLSDLADKFGTSPGELKRLQDVAQAQGMNPEHFNEMLAKYGEAIEKAREELKNPFQERSAGTAVVGRFANEANFAKSFQSFLEFLNTTGQGPGTDQPLTGRASRLFTEAAMRKGEVSEDVRRDLTASGELRHLSGTETRQAFEKTVFGQAQSGSSRRLINSNIDEVAKNINEPTIEELNTAIKNLSETSLQKNILDVQNQTRDFIEASARINGEMATAMANAEARLASEETARLESYQALRRGADAAEDIKQGLSNVLSGLSQATGHLKTITEWIPKATSSRLFKGIMNPGKKE